ncbi:PREDICTED: serine/threonine-protein kinase BLUS1-like [Ipomoea nil]|uniref:serine/threonine-protein kinase BLUS1-like n=1 Tax=Ipomoea nil TaxID=35883 RepID=UPI0009015DF3|nr:PREDICTED: serine/threonine-protein kinase BLUS1-like [Ipomoea nil]
MTTDLVTVNMDVTMDATFLSYTLPLPDSIGSVSNSVAIHHANRGQDHLPRSPMVFRARFVRDYGTFIKIYIVVNNPIGFSKNSSVLVYKAALVGISVSSYRSYTTLGSFCTLKVVDKDNPESIVLKEQVASIKDCWHKNLLGSDYNNFFVDEESKKMCYEIPHRPVSVRTIMKNKFPGGLPEDLILNVLRSVLTALQYLYERQKEKIMHRDIQAGHIYLCRNENTISHQYTIKLGFAGSVFDENDEEEEEMGQHPYLPMASMSEWGAAPEVYYGNDQPYSEKADIWLLGITALELACGGLKVPNRNALETIIKDIKLPPWKVATKFKYYAKKMLSSSNVKEVLVLPLLSEENCRKSSLLLYSRSFFKMVKQCLARDPKERPSANLLLQSNPLFLRDTWSVYVREKDIWNVFMNKTSS